MTAPARPGLAEVLAEHQRVLDGPGSCLCGEWPPPARDVDYTAHLAAVAAQWFADELASDDVREAVAEAIGQFVISSFTARMADAALAAVRATVGGGR